MSKFHTQIVDFVCSYECLLLEYKECISRQAQWSLVSNSRKIWLGPVRGQPSQTKPHAKGKAKYKMEIQLFNNWVLELIAM